jgi:hypothetical protein
MTGPDEEQQDKNETSYEDEIHNGDEVDTEQGDIEVEINADRVHAQ